MLAAPATGREMCLGRLGTQRRRAVHQLAPLLGGALQNLKYLEAKIWMNHGRRRMGMEGRAARIARGRSRLLGFGGKGNFLSRRMDGSRLSILMVGRLRANQAKQFGGLG